MAFSSGEVSDVQYLPVVALKSVDGKTMSTASFSNDGKPIVIDFWATWCKPCVQELSSIAKVYAQWQKETGVKIIAVSIDDARTRNLVASFVQERKWEYEVYLDENSDLSRAMNVRAIPHTLVLNGKGEIIAQHKGYSQGDENKLYEVIKQAASEAQAVGY